MIIIKKPNKQSDIRYLRNAFYFPYLNESKKRFYVFGQNLTVFFFSFLFQVPISKYEVSNIGLGVCVFVKQDILRTTCARHEI